MPTDRTEARARRTEARKAEAARSEQAAEQLAPGAQRHAVLANGEVIRHPRVERDGITFRASSPIRQMVARGGIDRDQERAAERLSAAWEIGGRDVAMAGRWYDGTRGTSTPQTGVIAEHVRAKIGDQNRARDEVVSAARAIGGGFNVIRAVALEGMDVAAWGRLNGGKNCQVAKGYLLAALDELVAFYLRLDAVRERTSRMRAAVVVQRGEVAAA
jgi:hypothetical protein